MKFGKIWGETRPLLATRAVEVHHITIEPNSRCSLHHHEFRFNGFYVLKGTLFIEVHKRDYDLVDVTMLGPGDFTTVPPGEKHQFSTKDEPVEALEIYYPDPGEYLRLNDIVRENCGSKAQ